MPAAAKGRPSGTPTKPWADALRLAALRVDSKTKQQKLSLLAEQTIKAGLAGDMSAVREIGDRLDGKATQPVEGANGGPLVVQIVRYADD